MSHWEMKLIFVSLLLGISSVIQANTIVVDTASSEFNTPSGAQISLREAIRDAGQTQATICFDPSLSGAILNNALYVIDSPAGNPGGVITIDATDLDEPITLSNGNASTALPNLRVLNRTVRLKGIHISRENATAAAVTGFNSEIRLEDCVLRSGKSFAASLNGGSLIAERCEIPEGSGLSLLNVERASITDSSIYHSKSAALRITPASSGAQSVFLRNCTFAENLQRNSVPGAVVVEGTGFSSITIDHCSFVDNATAGISVPTTSVISNSLFARNVGADGTLVSLIESAGQGGTSGGYNLADDAPAALSQPTDTLGADTKVSRIGYFGGDRHSCFPLAGSPAIDGGNANRPSLTPTGDGRGFFRNGSSTFNLNGNPVDIGAVETNPHGAIVVTSAADSGPGSLRAAVDAAFAESNAATHHIIIDSSLSGQVLTPLSFFFWEDNHNINIDGSALAIPLKITGNANNARFIISSAPGDFLVTGSLTGLVFSQIQNGTSFNLAQIFLNGGSRFGFQQLVFEKNRPRDRGTLDVFDAAEAFIDECHFSENRQLYQLSGLRGGAAITVRDASITVWNSTFEKNRADLSTDADGGAIKLDELSDAEFRHCTFSGNEAGRYGGAVHFTDGGAFVASGSFERCTFSNNLATEGGAISAPGFSNVAFQSCVFSENTITMAGTPETQDLYPGPTPGPSVASGAVNWSDASATSRQLIQATGLGLSIELAPTAFYGGFVPTAPFQVDGYPANGPQAPIDSFTPRDAIREPGFGVAALGGFIEAGRFGAVHRMVGASDVLQVTNVATTLSSITFTVSGAAGTRWQLETSTSLGSGWTPVNLFFEGGVDSLVTSLPSPKPDKFFIRFREVE